MKSERRILFVAGGTGGHMHPGVLLARAMLEHQTRWKAQFLLSGRRIERRFVPDELPCFELFPGIEGRPSLWRADRYGFALLRARRFIHEYQPDLVVQLGGYVSAVAHFAAPYLPNVWIDSNRLLGRAARIAGRHALRFFLQWPQKATALTRDRCRVTGVPVAFASVPEPEVARRRLSLAPDKTTLLVVGGSQGAHALNQRMIAGAADLSTAGVQVLHVAGEKDAALVADAYRKHGVAALVVPFLNAMDLAYGAADLVISRAGGMTVAELTVAGRPALLVPYPHHRDQHQELNALGLVEREAAWMLREHEIGADFVAREVLPRLLGHRELRRRAAQARSLARPDACEQILKEIDLLFDRKLSHRSAA